MCHISHTVHNNSQIQSKVKKKGSNDYFFWLKVKYFNVIINVSFAILVYTESTLFYKKKKKEMHAMWQLGCIVHCAKYKLKHFFSLRAPEKYHNL